MKYLLDTHTALWLFEGNANLPQHARDIIFDAGNQIYISIASAWEVAIKVSLSKLDLDGGVEIFLAKIAENHINLLGVRGKYLEVVERLPLIHRDPFDRMIVATAKTEQLTLITIDENIQKYDIPWMWGKP